MNRPLERASADEEARQRAARDRGAPRVRRPAPTYPALYQINTRVLLRQRETELGRPATLDDIEDRALDRIAAQGFDWVWFLGVWQTGEMAREIAINNTEWRREYAKALPGFDDRDICSSCFAITGYATHTALGGDGALQRLRERLASRGLRLMLDFVPNHVALDHPWIRSRPDLLVQGTADDLARAPQNYCQLASERGTVIFAHGRDPYFPGWPDTIQLNYGNPATQEAMRRELFRVAERCDGVRCDMAMLILPDVFMRTWGISSAPFWPNAIADVRRMRSDFCFMAEVYWDLEWTLQQQGFDLTYDKRLYDRLVGGSAGPVRDHLRAGLDYQTRMARFMENHDEPRAAETFPPPKYQAAAILTFLTPGLRFFHEGQFEGRTKRIPVQLCNVAPEPRNEALQEFYDRLLEVLRLSVVREGDWRLLEASDAWPGNSTGGEFIAFTWQASGGPRMLAVVNYAGNRGQCYIRLAWPDLAGTMVRLADRMSPAQYDRPGDDLLGKGLYLDLPEWGYHVFELAKP